MGSDVPCFKSVAITYEYIFLIYNPTGFEIIIIEFIASVVPKVS